LPGLQKRGNLDSIIKKSVGGKHRRRPEEPKAGEKKGKKENGEKASFKGKKNEVSEEKGGAHKKKGEKSENEPVTHAIPPRGGRKSNLNFQKNGGKKERRKKGPRRET